MGIVEVVSSEVVKVKVIFGAALRVSMPTDQFIYLFFFFQAEDGIRDYKVTGVQTCALPICSVALGAVRAAVKAAGGRFRAVEGARPHLLDHQEIGRASCRERV